jgi:hypothetical protein
MVVNELGLSFSHNYYMFFLHNWDSVTTFAAESWQSGRLRQS